MFKKNCLGLDIAENELRAVALRRAGKGSLISGGKLLPLAPGRLSVSPHKQNILDRSGFIADVRDLFDGIAGREERVSLTLPDFSGRLLLTEIETPFKNRAEGREILLWQMQKKMPTDLGELQIDFQTLRRDDSGRTQVLVGLLSKSIVEQYEDVLVESGFEPIHVELHALSLFNYYQPRIDLGEDFIFVGVERDSLIIKCFQERRLTFCRVKRVDTHPEQVFQEVNRSVVGLREQYGNLRRLAVFAHIESVNTDSYVSALRSIFEHDVTLLDPKIDRLISTGSSFATDQAARLTAAVGAAERLIKQ